MPGLSAEGDAKSMAATHIDKIENSATFCTSAIHERHRAAVQEFVRRTVKARLRLSRQA